MRVVNEVFPEDKNSGCSIIIENPPERGYRQVIVGIKRKTDDNSSGCDYIEIQVSGEQLIKAITNSMNC